MKKIGLYFLLNLVLQVIAVSASHVDSKLDYINFKIPAFENYLFSAQVDFLLSRMEMVVAQNSEINFESTSFLKTGSFLVDHYAQLSPSQQSRLFKCITI
jgi:hypothetical protein